MNSCHQRAANKEITSVQDFIRNVQKLLSQNLFWENFQNFDNDTYNVTSFLVTEAPETAVNKELKNLQTNIVKNVQKTSNEVAQNLVMDVHNFAWMEMHEPLSTTWLHFLLPRLQRLQPTGSLRAWKNKYSNIKNLLSNIKNLLSMPLHKFFPRMIGNACWWHHMNTSQSETTINGIV